jgi:hypothetical protein
MIGNREIGGDDIKFFVRLNLETRFPDMISSRLKLILKR